MCGWRSATTVDVKTYAVVSQELDEHLAEVEGISVDELRARLAKLIKRY